MCCIIAEALATNPRLGAIKVKLGHIFAGDVTAAPLAGSLITATSDELLDFGV